jgi:hypothetical protein
MPDIRELHQNQTVIRAELDRMKPEAWRILQGNGEEWTERLDQMLRGFAGHDEDPWRILGLLAQIGFLHLLESFEP